MKFSRGEIVLLNFEFVLNNEYNEFSKFSVVDIGDSSGDLNEDKFSLTVSFYQKLFSLLVLQISSSNF